MEYSSSGISHLEVSVCMCVHVSDVLLFVRMLQDLVRDLTTNDIICNFHS